MKKDKVFKNDPIKSKLYDFLDTKRPFQTRMSLPKLCNVNSHLKPNQLAVLDKMGFGAIARIQSADIDRNMIIWLMEKYNPLDEELEIYGEVFRLTDYSVYEAFGIPYTGHILTADSNDTTGYDTYKYDIPISNNSVDIKELSNRLVNCENDTDLFKVMYMTFMMGTFLMPGKQYNIPFKYLNLLAPVTLVGSINWASMVIDYLNIGARTWKAKDSGFVCGCLYLLQVIFLGRVRSEKAKSALNSKTQIPFINYLTADRMNQLKDELIIEHDGYWVKGVCFDASKEIVEKTEDAKLAEDEKKCRDFMNHSSPITDMNVGQFMATYGRSWDNPVHSNSNNVDAGTDTSKFNKMVINRIDVIQSQVAQLAQTVNLILMQLPFNHLSSGIKPVAPSFDIATEIRTCIESAFLNLSKKYDRTPSVKYQGSSSKSTKHTKQQDSTASKSTHQRIRKELNFNSVSRKRKVHPDKHEGNSNDKIELTPCNPVESQEEIENFLFNHHAHGRDIVVHLIDWFLSRNDIECLLPGQQVNSPVIDCVAYMRNLQDMEDKISHPKWFFPTVLSEQLLNKNYNVEDIAKSFFSRSRIFDSFFNCEQMFIPIHDQINHWFCVIIDLTTKTVSICDSLPSTETEKNNYRWNLAKSLVNRLDALFQVYEQTAEFERVFAEVDFSYERADWVPKQDNGYA